MIDSVNYEILNNKEIELDSLKDSLKIFFEFFTALGYEHEEIDIDLSDCLRNYHSQT